MKDGSGLSPADGTEDEDFGALFAEFEESEPTRAYRSGERVKGTVVSVGGEFAFVSLGGKAEGLVACEELLDDEGDLLYVAGDAIEATVISTSGPDGAVRLSLNALKASLDDELLQEAFASQHPVEGRVASTNKGGYVVTFGGKEAFCPLSQMELGFTEDPSIHVGKEYVFLLTELGRGRLVVSRSAHLQKAKEARKEELKQTLHVGDVVDGVVDSIRDFGAFVDLGGIQGLAHVSQMSWSRVTDVNEVLSVGDKVRGKITELDWSRDRIGISLREAEGDPWESLTLKAGDRVTGTVSRLADFGAFVEVAGGIEGLIHLSEMSWTQRVRRPSDLLTVGDSVDVAVLDVNPLNRRISLGLKQMESDPWSQVVHRFPVGTRAKGLVEKVADFGVFLSVGEGITGLIPNREMDTDRNANHRRDFPENMELEVVVIELDAEGRRLTLSRKALKDAEARHVPEGSLGESNPRSLRTFADLMKDKFGAIKLDK